MPTPPVSFRCGFKDGLMFPGISECHNLDVLSCHIIELILVCRSYSSVDGMGRRSYSNVDGMGFIQNKKIPHWCRKHNRNGCKPRFRTAVFGLHNVSHVAIEPTTISAVGRRTRGDHVNHFVNGYYYTINGCCSLNH